MKFELNLRKRNISKEELIADLQKVAREVGQESIIQKVFSDIKEQKDLSDFTIAREIKKGRGSAIADAIKPGDASRGSFLMRSSIFARLRRDHAFLESQQIIYIDTDPALNTICGVLWCIAALSPWCLKGNPVKRFWPESGAAPRDCKRRAPDSHDHWGGYPGKVEQGAVTRESGDLPYDNDNSHRAGRTE